MLEETQLKIEGYEFEPTKTIKGFPELHWTGKRPYRSTQYFPAQLKERYGEEKDGWINKLFWGDNLQVMSHLLKEYRGQIDLIYIDPPFDSKADYKKKIKLQGKEIANDNNSFEEKQYGDIWTNDEYLQFMYERLILCRELLSTKGTIYLHCDWHKNSAIRCIMDEIFGPNNFLNEIIWYYRRWNIESTTFSGNHDTIYAYCKNKGEHVFNQLYIPKSSKSSGNGRSWVSVIGEDGVRRSILTDEISKGVPMPDVWNQDISDYYQTGEDFWEISMINPVGNERVGYPTQKPEALIERIIKASSNEDSIVFDSFMGSGTTQSVAMKLGRKFIGADINLGAIQTTTKRLINVAGELNNNSETYKGFEVYNVNNYDFFRNPIEAKDLLIQALEIQKFDAGSIYDGELDGRMVKIMPVNRIATKADLEELKANFPYKTFESRKAEHPNDPVERLTLVCMGHEADLKASLEQSLSEYKIDINIVDILRDKTNLQLKREAEANIECIDGKLVIKSFYPLNLMQKLSLEKEYVEDWKQLVESIMIDWNYDGVVMQPTVTDVPDKNSFVQGEYDIPEDAGKIKIKITDVLSEALEMEV